MDFISSISFLNEPLISCTLAIFVITFGWVQQQTHPKVMTKMVKKCSTDQRFIRKRNTIYKIGTLENGQLQLGTDRMIQKSCFSLTKHIKKS